MVNVLGAMSVEHVLPAISLIMLEFVITSGSYNEVRKDQVIIPIASSRYIVLMSVESSPPTSQ